MFVILHLREAGLEKGYIAISVTNLMMRFLAILGLFAVCVAFFSGFAASTSPPPPPERPDYNVSPASDYGWTNYTESIENCKEGGECTFEDDFKAEIVHADKGNTLRFSSGRTGYCGKAVLKKNFEVPEDAEWVNFNFKAYQDRWGKNRPMKIKLNNETLESFQTSEPRYNVWGWTEYSHRLEPDTESANISLVIEDRSDKWCDMSDHTNKLYLHNISFTESYLDVQNFPKVGEPNKIYDHRRSRDRNNYDETKDIDDVVKDNMHLFLKLVELIL